MLEVCSPVVSSTSHPEMKAAMRTGPGAGPGYHAVAAGENNIGSIITMLIGSSTLLQILLYCEYIIIIFIIIFRELTRLISSDHTLVKYLTRH